MIVLRKTINEEQKEFSDVKNYEGNSNSGMNFLMKIFLMPDLDNGKHIEHWLENSSTGIYNAANGVDLSGYVLNYAVPFLGVSFQSERKRYLNTLYFKFKTNTPYDYVLEKVENVFGQKKGNVLKYARAIREISEDEIKDFISKFRYIAMCLNGQIDEEVVNWWDVNPGRDRINFVSPSSYNYENVEDLQKKLFNILCKVDPSLYYNSHISHKFR